MAHNSNELSKDGKSLFNAHGAVAQSLISLNSAIDGTGVIQHPQVRIMTGAVTSAHAAEQAASVAANTSKVLPISETGKALFS